MSLRDGAKKMSKSDASDQSRINLTDGPDDIALKIRRARTDPDAMPGPEALGPDGKTVDPEKEKARPEAFNLLSIYAALTERDMPEVLDHFAGKQFSDFKQQLTEVAVEMLGPIGNAMQRLMAEPGYVDSVLHDGGERAHALAGPVLREVREVIGYLQD
jgi:tryptophanyl-tRNA synthetase